MASAPEESRAGACPERAALEMFATGVSTDADTRAHVDTCLRCQRELDLITRDNDLFAELAVVSDATFVEGAAAAETIPEIPGYELIEELHRGGQGVVWKAWHPTTKRTVAIKLILQGAFATSSQRARFEREVELVASLRWPGIITVYDSGMTPKGQLFVVMEYVEGVTLTDWFAIGEAPTTSPMTVRETMELFAEICESVSFAHRRGIIHRDLKPANILVDEQGRPHVLDFGIAKQITSDVARSGLTVEGEFVGTFSYAAPEQVSRDPGAIDIRTDVFALGVIMYEALTGRRARRLSGAMTDMIRAIVEEDPEPPSRHRPEIRGDVETIVLTAMQRDPERRYPSARHLLDDIRNHLEGRPINARRSSLAYVVGKNMWRYRRPLAGAALLLVIAAATLIWVLTVIIGARADRDAKWTAARSYEKIFRILDTESQVLDVAAIEDIPSFLEAASLIIEEDLADHPEIRATVLTGIGQAYLEDRWNSENRVARAVEQIRTGLELRRELFTTPNAQIAESLHHLGRAYWKSGDYAAAAANYREALEMRDALHGADHPDVAETKHHLGSTLARLGRYEEGLDYCSQAIETIERLRGADHFDTAVIWNTMGVCYRRMRDTEKADECFSRSLRIVRAEKGDGDWRVVRLLNNMASYLTDDGQYDKARARLNEALSILETHSGLDHPDTAAGLVRLARINLLIHRERRAPNVLSMAATQADRAVAILRKSGDADLRLAEALSLLGQILEARARIDDAVAAHEEALALREGRLSRYHDDVLVSRAWLGRAYAKALRFQDAEMMFLAVLDGRRRDDGGVDEREACRDLVELYRAWNRPEQAALYRECADMEQAAAINGGDATRAGQ